MRRGGLILIAGLALAACAHGHLWFDALSPASSIGAVDRYGTDSLTIEPGGEIVSFALAEAAEIALVAVTSEGRVSVLYPNAHGEFSGYAAGLHVVVVPVSLEWPPDPSARAPALAKEGRRGRPGRLEHPVHRRAPAPAPAWAARVLGDRSPRSAAPDRRGSVPAVG